jgi:hypothetical protein
LPSAMDTALGKGGSQVPRLATLPSVMVIAHGKGCLGRVLHSAKWPEIAIFFAFQ